MPSAGFRSVNVTERTYKKMMRLRDHVQKHGTGALLPDVKFESASLAAVVDAAVDLLSKRIA